MDMGKLAGGGKPAGAVGVAALSGLPTILGALAGYGAGTMNPLVLAVSLSFAAGVVMAQVVVSVLMPVFMFVLMMSMFMMPMLLPTVGMGVVGLLVDPAVEEVGTQVSDQYPAKPSWPP